MYIFHAIALSGVCQILFFMLNVLYIASPVLLFRFGLYRNLFYLLCRETR